MNVYATAEEVKEYLSIVSEDDDQLLRSFCIEASREIDAWCFRKFYPALATKYFDHPDFNTLLPLDEDLLAVTTLTTQNDNTTITSSDYYLMRGNSYNRTPYNAISLKHDEQWYAWTGTPQKANKVIGTWGYHNDWSNAWADSQDEVEDNPLTAAATTLTVNSVGGKDERGIPGRFNVQQLLRIESEYLYVTDIQGPANTLTVIRGINGTTAAQHAQNTQIDIYRPMPDVVKALKTLASYAYKRRDAIGSDGDRALVSADGIVVMPNDFPAEVKALLKRYRRRNRV
jgi:hypothetical protein